jgi:hypothetical protein
MLPSNATPPRPARRVPSLKLKRLNVAKLRQQSRDSNNSNEVDIAGGSSAGTADAATGNGTGTPTGASVTATVPVSTAVPATTAGDVRLRGAGGGVAGGGAQPPNTMPYLLRANSSSNHPAITITLESDNDSVYSDYLSPEINNIHHQPTKVQFLGDEQSLYGTPKEELLPTTADTMASPPDQKSTTSFLKTQIMTFFQPSDNKLAMKLFGNKNALMKEKMRHKSVGNWVIHPCSNFRSVSALPFHCPLPCIPLSSLYCCSACLWLFSILCFNSLIFFIVKPFSFG